jgi:hypothetical protein
MGEGSAKVVEIDVALPERSGEGDASSEPTMLWIQGDCPPAPVDAWRCWSTPACCCGAVCGAGSSRFSEAEHGYAHCTGKLSRQGCRGKKLVSLHMRSDPSSPLASVLTRELKVVQGEAGSVDGSA